MAHERILIVEDELILAEQLQKQLKKLGYHLCDVANSGEEALQIFEECRPQLVLMDIHLSHDAMDGIEVAEEFRRRADVPVIFLTAYTDRETIERAKQTMPFGYLLKPLRQHDIENTVAIALYKHRMDSELRKAHAELERRVQERTAELHKYQGHLEELVEERTNALQQEIAERKQIEKKLQQARIEADASNKAKSEFLANMSHELRTPLNGILGYAQILKQEEQLTEFQRSSIETIERSGRHLLHLINEILDLSKIEAQKMELHETEIHFSGFLSGISEIIRIRAQQKGIAFRYETTSELPQFICTDERHLSQILLNLLSNAVKFTDQGGVSLKVGERWTLEQHWREQASPDVPNSANCVCIRFQVSDSGIGIPATELQEIFSPFTQISDHTREKEGTGLGLAISRELARLMGSELHVRSVPNKGSTFWFDLQFHEIDREPEYTESPLRSIKQVKGEAPTILIVDDKDENRLLLRDMLHPLGFRLLEAGNGHEAIEQTQRHHPNLILMDLIMPEMDGFDAVEQIRREFSADDIIIIAISASAFEQTRQKSMMSGCHDFLSKPVSSQELLTKLEKYLKLEWIYDEQGHTAPPMTPPPRDELLELYRLTQIGDILKIRHVLNRVESEHPESTAFCERLRQLSKELNILEIDRFLKRFLEE